MGVGNEPVGRLHDLALADLARGGLGPVAIGQGQILHLGHRVHGVHQGNTPALGREPSDLPGEPVVGVHQVIPPGLVLGLRAQHARGDGAQLGREILLRQALERSRDHVTHLDPRGELHNGIEV